MVYYVKGERKDVGQKGCVMSRESRQTIKSSFFHVMVQGLNKEYIFNSNIDKKVYLKNIKNIKLQYNIEVIAYCIMDNHAHLLLKVNTTSDLSKFMHKINTLYALYYNKKNNRVGYVFRDRYKSQIIYSEKQLYACINYIHNNPVKAKICNNQSDYKYSSFKEYNANMFFKGGYFEDIVDIEEKEKNITFLEDEEQKDVEIKNYINSFLEQNNLDINNLKKNRKQLEILVITLKDEYNIPYRKISEYLNIGREILRKIVNDYNKK